MPPESWFWSHDIRPDQVGSIRMPGMRLVRLSCYGDGDRRRFAALVHQEPGPERTYLLDAAVDELSRTTGHPVAVTANGGRFSVVLAADSGPATVRAGLDEAELLARQGVVDLATYVEAGTRRYAVVLAADPAPVRLFTAVTAAELEARLKELDATPVRLRGYAENGRQLLAAVAEPSAPGIRSWWYADLDADEVAGRLERHRAYPIDLDATRDARGVRFTVVMRR
jgi:hypothetical protein